MPSSIEEKKGGDEKQFVIFSLGEEEFGVNISEVREIIKMENITRIPNTEEYIRGVINLRGGIIVIIDLAMKLGFQTKEYDKDTRIIVIEVNDNTVGMIVDSATEVLRISSDNIKPAPPILLQKMDAEYIDGVGILGERLLIILDLAKVLAAKEIQQVQNLQKKAIIAEKKEETSAPEAKIITSEADKKPVTDAQKKDSNGSEKQQPKKEDVKSSKNVDPKTNRKK